MGVKDWLADRFGLRPIKRNFLDRRVPKTPWYFGDGSTLLLLFGVMVGTGAFLSLDYSASTDSAYASVRYITQEPLLGWFLRALHYWSAGLMVVMLFVHLLRQLLVGGYKFPREGTWLIGVMLFYMVMTNAFTGYVLRWDERGIYAIRVVASILDHVPYIGSALAAFVLGGPEIGPTTLTRVYSVHVIFVPLALTGLIAYHVYLVVLRGITGVRDRPVESSEEHEAVYHAKAESEDEGEPFYPDAMAASGLMGVSVFALALVLAVVFGPRALYPEANMVSTSMPREEWYFAWYSGLVALLPPAVAPLFAWTFPIVLAGLLVALPWLDRHPYRGVKHRPAAVAVVSLTVVALVGLTALRMQSPWTGWPRPEPPPVPAGVSIPPPVEAGRVLFAEHGCNSCHAVAGVGPKLAPDLAGLTRRYSPAELRDYILHPPPGVPMPAYAEQLRSGKLTDEELKAIVEYVLVAQTFPGGH